ncbi:MULTISPECIES: hypothetical protein [unclassified Streptomyces]|nr:MULTISPECIES: hypothetical protein [unclassified Streptomyces]
MVARVERTVPHAVPASPDAFLGITDRSAREPYESPAATGERGGA